MEYTFYGEQSTKQGQSGNNDDADTGQKDSKQSGDRSFHEGDTPSSDERA